MREFLLYALAVVVLVIPRINAATVSNKEGRIRIMVKFPKPRKLVKNPNQTSIMGCGCWSQGNVILFIMDEDPCKLRAYRVQKGKRGKPSIK